MRRKICIIGAGSLGFARRLFRDILSVEELQDTHFALTDISRRNLNMIYRLCDKDLQSNRHIGKRAKLTATTNRRHAIADADYIINCSRIGGLKAYKLDIKIPLKYGIDQCIGDTLCAGGIMYGQRNIPAILDFCRDIREVAKPNALFMNYANPMAINTWAAIDFGGVNAIGLCHGVEHGWQLFAMAFKCKYPDDVEGTCIGINHQTWYTNIRLKGRQISANELISALEANSEIRETEKCRIDVLKRFGYFSTESNGHLSEYLPWYRKRPSEIHKYVSRKLWIYGETGGYLRYLSKSRNAFEKEFPKLMAVEDLPMGPTDRSAERGSYIIEALETGRKLRTYANVKNNGTISNLSDDCIVEVPVYVDKNGINVPRAGELPLACAATCMASVNVQRMAVRAAVSGDMALLKQAMMHDPLTAAVCNTEEIWRLTDEMVVAQAEWLPQYRRAVSAAKIRLRDNVIKTKNRKNASLRTRR